MPNKIRYEDTGWPTSSRNIYKKDVKDINDWLRKQVAETIKKEELSIKQIANELRDEAQRQYLDAYYAGENDVTVSVRQSSKGTTQIVASGEALPFIEFGTGNGEDAWYFSTEGKNIAMDGDQPVGGQWALRRKRTDDPEKTNKKNADWISKNKATKGSKQLKEVLYQSPKSLETATLKQWEESYQSARIARGMNPLNDEEIKNWLTLNIVNKFDVIGGNEGSFVDARYKKHKAQYKMEESKEAIRTYGNKPHHIMSRIYELFKDKIEEDLKK